jgi:CBS domain-containing protein
MNRHVGDLMTTSVITVAEGAKFHEIAALMREYGVSAVPVQKFPREPTISAIWRPMAWSAAGAPPTSAEAWTQHQHNQARTISARVICKRISIPSTGSGKRASRNARVQCVTLLPIFNALVADSSSDVHAWFTTRPLGRVDACRRAVRSRHNCACHARCRSGVSSCIEGRSPG